MSVNFSPPFGEISGYKDGRLFYDSLWFLLDGVGLLSVDNRIEGIHRPTQLSVLIKGPEKQEKADSGRDWRGTQKSLYR